MKIGLVLSNTPEYSETFFISKIKGLQKKGFQVILFVGKNKKDFDLCEVQTQVNLKPFSLVLTSFKLFYKSLFYLKRVRSFMKLEREDGQKKRFILKKILLNQHILFANNIAWLHFGFATQALGKENIAKAIGAKMGVSLRGFDIDVYPLKHPNCYNKLWKRVDKVHAISKYLLTKASTLGLEATIPSQIITPAVSSEILKINSPKEDTTLKIVTVGRLHWIKNYTAILKALKELKENGISFQYHIIGVGNLLEALQYEVYQYQLESFVIFEGKLHHKEALQKIASSDIYIQYSHSEGFCNAVLEAQALGVLSIVADVGALPENIIHNKTGWIVSKNNPSLLRAKIEEVLQLSEERKSEVLQNAIERVKNKFNLEKQVLEFVQFYKN